MFTAAQLQQLGKAIDWSKLPGELAEQFDDERMYQERREEQEAEDAERRAAAVPLQVPDFHSVAPGTLVVRSDHWKRERNDPANKQLGIITDLMIYEDDLCGFIHWPVVHWAGELSSGTNHPLNVALQDGRELPVKTMNSNQILM